MKNPLCDMHIHTYYSCDSEVRFETHCLEALEKGIKTICFTDHVECNCNDHGCGFYNPERFFAEFIPLKEKYKNELTILCGVEFAEPHLYREELTKYQVLPYDYILGAVHWWYENMWASEVVKKGIPVEVSYRHYWNEVLLAVKSGGFNCLAHMDFPKRYHGELLYEKNQISEICTEMVRANICLEINTSSLRKDSANGTMPDKELLEIYKSCGGKYVTFGSDAHRSGEMGSGYLYMKDLIDYFGFEEVTFIQKEMRKVG